MFHRTSFNTIPGHVIPLLRLILMQIMDHGFVHWELRLKNYLYYTFYFILMSTVSRIREYFPMVRVISVVVTFKLSRAPRLGALNMFSCNPSLSIVSSY